MLSFTYKEKIMDTSNINDQDNKANLSTSRLPRMLHIKEVMYHTGFGNSTIYSMLDKKSKHYDSTFPIQVKLSKGRVAWVESEIEEWLDAKIADRVH
jgi:prophage regulatory protein